MSKLTAKQKKFCDEYVKSGNTRDAVIKTGYSPKTTYSVDNKNLDGPGLKFYTEEQMKRLKSKKAAGTREVLRYLSSVMRDEQTESVTTARGVYDDVPVSVKDGVSTAKEILRKYPVGPLGKAQLRRANADARVIEAKTKAVEGSGQDIEQLLDKILISLDKADDRNSSN